MAANEHKNLSSINRHLPIDFENATNDTVLSKNAGSDPTLDDGALVYQSKTLMGTSTFKIQGYANGILTNYVYGEDIQDQRSPYQMDIDYGSAVVASGSLAPIAYFRVGQGYVADRACAVRSVSGWLTANHNYVYTIAICKITPVSDSDNNVVPIVIDEIAVAGLADNDRLVRVNETTITTNAVAAGDIIFPMLKSATSGSNVYINLTVQTTSY